MANTTTKTVNPLRKVLLSLAVVVAMAIGALLLIRSQVPGSAPSGVPVELGAQLAHFELEKFGGGKVSTAEQKGKIYFVNFWASWCEGCIVEMPSILELEKAYRERGFQLISINLDDKPESILPKVLPDLKMTHLPIFVDREGQLVELFDVRAIPLTVILDGEMKVLFIESGERDWNGSEIHEKLEQWLSG